MAHGVNAQNQNPKTKQRDDEDIFTLKPTASCQFKLYVHNGFKCGMLKRSSKYPK